MLPKGGAYSKRYQAEERERMRQWLANTGNRNSRDREHFLSRQTALRQRALEQRKRAMERAEEERRRKALEDRRQTQREAMERCKMAISRLRLSSSSSRPSNRRQRDIPVEIHHGKPTTDTTAVRHSPTVSSSPPTASLSQAERRGGGRVVLGAQVELRGDSGRRAPALDEVLMSIRGQQTSPKPPSPSPSPSLPSRPSSVQGGSRQATPTATRPQSSISDPSITTHCPIYKVQHAEVSQPSPSSKSSPTDLNSSSERDKKEPDADRMVFHPVIRGPPRMRAELSRDAHPLRITSPTQESVSSCGSPVDSLSTDLSDIDSAMTSGTGRKVVRRHKKIVKKEKSSTNNGVNDSSGHTKKEESSNPVKMSTGCISSESSSDDESAPPRLSPPRSRRRRKLPPGGPNQRGYIDPLKREEPQGPRIVGILKKPHGDRRVDSHHLDSRDKVFESVSAIASTANSLPERSHRTRGIGCENQTVSVSSAGTAKRVRFSETLESSLDSSQTFVHPTLPHSTSLSTTSDTTIEQLWQSLLLPSSNSTQHQYIHTPNVVFSPRMKVFLSQRGKGHQQKDSVTQGDRITVHIPQAGSQLPQEGVRESLCSPTERKGEQRADNRERKNKPVSVNGEASLGKLINNKERRSDDAPDMGESVEAVEHSTRETQVWEDKQNQLHTPGESDRVMVAPQVYKFSQNPQNTGHPGPKSGGTRYLPHRPQQKPSRGHGVGQSHTHQKWAEPYAQLHRRHHVIHVQSDPSYVTGKSPWEPHIKTTSVLKPAGLAHYDEQKVVQSLQQINQRLKEHEMVHGPYVSYTHPHSPHPPQYHPVTVKAQQKRTDIVSTRH